MKPSNQNKMNFTKQYEDITSAEADFIIDLYEHIEELVRNNQPVTLVRLGYDLGVKPSALSDYLTIIITMLSEVEERYEAIR